MKPKTIIGEAAAETSRFDWAVMLGSYALGVVALRLGVPLWAAAIIAFIGVAVIGVKHSCRNLGLLDKHDADGQDETPSRAPSGVAGSPGRAALSPTPRP